MQSGLKRVDWQMGQMLLPHHMVAHEESLLSHLSHLLLQVGIPFFGVSRLQWDEALLTQGILSISELSLIFPTGQLVANPGNAHLASFDLNAAGKSDVVLYLHVLEERNSVEQEMQWMEDTAKITFRVEQLTLSTQRNLELSKAVFKLAHFVKSPESQWKLSEDFIPPMLRTEAAPFFSAVFEKLSRALEGTKKKLEREIESAELFANQNLQWRLAMMEIKRLQRFLSQIHAGHVVLHPYFLYEKLCHLLDCSESKIPTYDHENLGELFHHLILKIESLFTQEQKDFSFMEFERRDASFVVENLPQTLAKGGEIYLIIQKPQVQTTLSLHGLKLTSKQRLTHVRHFSLPGISLIPIKKPAFLSSRFADEIDAYIVEQKDEWKKALAEGNLVVFHQDITADFKLYLYWRHSDGSARQI